MDQIIAELELEENTLDACNKNYIA